MEIKEFIESLNSQTEPSLALPESLQALWWESKKADWDKAHEIAQDLDNADGAWVHAYLHRVEGGSGEMRHTGILELENQPKEGKVCLKSGKK